VAAEYFPTLQSLLLVSIWSLTLELSGGVAVRLDDWLGRHWIVTTPDVAGYEMKDIAANGTADGRTNTRVTKEHLTNMAAKTCKEAS
jgi:hypothetical protein